jgi:hypothetical protein
MLTRAAIGMPHLDSEKDRYHRPFPVRLLEQRADAQQKAAP